MFAWPAPSYTRISDEYGERMHPTLNVKKFHNGLDMAAPGGSPILAAYNGTVVAAAYSSTMGNYIMIDHGDNLYTIYMHASKLYVSQGAEVSRSRHDRKIDGEPPPFWRAAERKLCKSTELSEISGLEPFAGSQLGFII